jgi:hypothetical protein
VSPRLTNGAGTPSMASGQHMVTIGIPTFNRVGTLGRAIASAQEQDHDPLEILVVDNCSTDGTAELVAELAAADPRVRLVRQPHNLGAVVNFETALLEARGEFFMWLADDDWLSPGYLSSCLHKLVTEAHAAVVGRDFWHHPEGPVQDPEVVVVEPGTEARILSYLRQGASNAAFYGVARTADLRSLLPFSTYLGSDWWWMLDLACRGSISVSRDAELHRSLGGMSSDWRGIAAHMGLGWFPRHLPATAFAVGVTRHLAASHHVAAIGGRPRRLALALRGGMILALRYGVLTEVFSGPARRRIQRVVPPGIYARLRRAYHPVRQGQGVLRRLAIAPPHEASASVRAWIGATLRNPFRY